MDEVFGMEQFGSEIRWKRVVSTGSSKAISKKYPVVDDSIFFYTKSANYEWNTIFKDYSDEYKAVFVQAMNHRVAGYVVLEVFGRVLKEGLIEQLEPTIEGDIKALSSLEPFAYSGEVLEARKCVLSLVPCNNKFERQFAAFLENAADVRAFSTLPLQFGFSIEYTDNQANLRYYYPDFVVKTDLDEMWLVETKGQESIDVRYKDAAALLWCENASRLTGQRWRYVKVPQKEYDKLQPIEFSDLQTFTGQSSLF